MILVNTQKVWFITGVVAVQSKFIFFVYFLNASLHVDENEEFLKNGSTARLLIESKGHALHAFVNEVLYGCSFFLPCLCCLNLSILKKMWSLFKQMLSLGGLVQSFLIWSTFWFSGSASGNGTVSPFKTQIPISLKAGNNEIALLCMTVGLSVGYFTILLSFFWSCLLKFSVILLSNYLILMRQVYKSKHEI